MRKMLQNFSQNQKYNDSDQEFLHRLESELFVPYFKKNIMYPLQHFIENFKSD